MKRLRNSAIIAFAICLCGCLYNYLSFKRIKMMPLAIRTWGGECMLEEGFGMSAFHVYAMTPDGSNSVRLGFSILNFLLYFAAVCIIIYLLITVFVFFKECRKK